MQIKSFLLPFCSILISFCCSSLASCFNSQWNQVFGWFCLRMIYLCNIHHLDSKILKHKFSFSLIFNCFSLFWKRFSKKSTNKLDYCYYHILFFRQYFLSCQIVTLPTFCDDNIYLCCFSIDVILQFSIFIFFIYCHDDLLYFFQ